MPLLVEKYRPQKLEDVVGFKPTFEIGEDMPHLLLYGPPGTGKTTLAKIIIKMLKCDYIILNASEERGIDVIRQKVMAFSSTKSKDGNIKICILDEADFLTQESQTALRNILETYSSNTRFILTCNYLQKIIDPIQSRCVLIRFNNLPKESIIKRMIYICENEKIPYEISALEKIIEKTGSDIRLAINKIEELKNGVLLNRIMHENIVADEIFILIKKHDFVSARQVYLDSQIDPEKFIQDLYNVIINSNELDIYKQNATLIISEEYRWLSFVSWPQILIESLLLKLIAIV